MRATSLKYPQLHVHDIGVRFVDGEAEATAAQAEALRQLPDDLGVTVEPAKPKRRRGKGDEADGD
ncbi:MAG: hypothetical protein ACRD0P_27220 [Stackebrandtia sp.]